MTDDWRLKAIGTWPNGSREFDPVGKERLITECLQPGVSLSGLALRYGVNANLLRKWVIARKKALGIFCKGPTSATAPMKASAFIPVVPAGPDTPAIMTRPSGAKAAGGMMTLPCPAVGTVAKMNASLPNGVTLALECDDARLVVTIIGALGNVPSVA
jgi:transposase